MPHAFASTLRTFKTASGKEGSFYSLPELAKADPNVRRLPVSIRIVLESVLRNCDGKKVTEEDVRELANWQPNGAAHGRDPVRRRARRAAGLHRRAAARRPRRDAQRRRATGQEPEDRSSRSCRSTWSSTTRCRSTTSARKRRARPQHGDRVQAQPRALPVPEVGHAGVRHLRRRAAGHRHRPPGQPRVPGARRARREGRRLLSRLARRHRLAHDDDQRPRRRRLGRRRHRGRGRRCSASRSTS